ncbi:MAG: head GIN domain-containing protein [Salinivirgaceae bacterium]|jgi:hypothetical protein|nr:DUF2807 domain-containing protein [Bacteroidales bacterium]
MKAKTFLTVILVAFAIEYVSAQDSRIVKKNINVDNFTSINASGAWDVIIKQANLQSVSIEVSEEFVEYVVIEVKEGVLNISSKPVERSENQLIIYGFWDILRMFYQGFENSWNNDSRIIRKAYITITELAGLNASGSVDVIFETPLETKNFKVKMSGSSDLENLLLKCSSFDGRFSGSCNSKIRFLSATEIFVNASGSSDVVLHDIDAEQCQITLTGSSDAYLSGKSKCLKLSSSGSSDVIAKGLVSQICEASFSGSSDGNVYVTDNLNISVSGASDIVCYGNPQNVKKSVSKAGSLTIND